MTDQATDTYGKKEADADYDRLVEFHERIYGGIQHTEKQIQDEHARWWRLATYYKDVVMGAPLEVMLTLIYTQKYLPSTYGDEDG